MTCIYAGQPPSGRTYWSPETGGAKLVCPAAVKGRQAASLQCSRIHRAFLHVEQKLRWCRRQLLLQKTHRTELVPAAGHLEESVSWQGAVTACQGSAGEHRGSLPAL